MHGNEQAIAVENPGGARFSSQFRGLLMLSLLVGIAAFLIALKVDAQRAWYGFLVNYLYFVVLSLGGVFLIALEGVTSATWSVVFRRLPEAFSTYLPAAFLLGIVLLIGVPHIYVWARPGFDFQSAHKALYFGRGFYDTRTLLTLLLWLGFGAWFVRSSLAMETHPGVIPQNATFGKLSTLRGRMSALFLIVFAYSWTIVFVDWVMSLEPHWDTTMWGVYGFAGIFESSLAMIMFFSVLMRRRGMFGGNVHGFHYVDLSRMLHAFSIFMVYIGFAQYGLIWYANYREESIYYFQRSNGGWGWVFIFLLFAKWVLPFTILLIQKVRTNDKVLLSMSGLILVAEWFDMYWLVMPAIHSTFWFPGWVELGTFLAFLGIFGLIVTRFLSKHPTVPIGDPRLSNSVAGRYL